MKIGPYLVATVLSAGLAAHAQEPIVRPAVEFNGASIKLSRFNGVEYLYLADNGNVSARGYDARMLIRDAYDLTHFNQIKEGPAWISSDSFDLRAIAGQGARPDQIPLMLRSLLIDRFKLRAHWEIRDEPVYALELARQDGALKGGLKPSTVDCWTFWEKGRKGDAHDAPRDDKGQPICFSPAMQVGGRLQMGGVPWSDIFPRLAFEAEFFGGLDRPVVDHTGLSGNFELRLEFRREYRGELPESLAQLALPSVKDALQEQLGLKLVAKTEPWKVLVIDSIERPTLD